MSHLVRVKTLINNKDILCAALKRLEWPFVSQGENLLVESIKLIHQADGTYQIEGDPYYCRELRKYYNNEKQLHTDLMTNYNIELAKHQLEDMGFNLTENEEGEVGRDGKICMVYESIN